MSKTPRSSVNTIIRKIGPSSTLELRRAILRPHLEINDCRQEGDSDPTTQHLGAYIGNDLVGVASVYSAAVPTLPEVDGWRLRGMAVGEAARNRNIGEELLLTAIQYAREQGGTVFWCYSRVSAIGFYEKYGFTGSGEVFDFPNVGPVKFMSLNIVTP